MQSNNFVLWQDAKIFSMTDEQQHHVIEDGAIVTQEGKIQWIGEKSQIPSFYLNKEIQQVSFKGKIVTPGLIDCHTHVVYGGNRVDEFAKKISGISYDQILKDGGGIYSTVTATRMLSEKELYDLSIKRIKYFLSQGVTTLEIKSGYGLDYENERKILCVAKMIEKNFPMKISTTFLGAHVLAPEFKDKKTYIKYLSNTVLPELVSENLVDAVDGFCDDIGFDYETLNMLFKKAQDLNLGIKLHSDQLSHSQGAQCASLFKVWSVDHLEFITETDIIALAKSGTVAVLLPGAYYYLQTKQKPPIDLLRKYKIPLALATDCNPGSSPCLSLLTILNMGCVLFRLTPFEALRAVTRHGARALGLENKKGQLKYGYDADFVVWDIEHPDELSYYLGGNPAQKVISKGKIVYEANQ